MRSNQSLKLLLLLLLRLLILTSQLYDAHALYLYVWLCANPYRT